MKPQKVFALIVFQLLPAVLFAQQSWIFQALKDEMTRSLSDLKIDTNDPPYYMAYTVTEFETYTIRATIGGVISQSRTPRSRSINIQLRVGSQKFDNTNFVTFSGAGRSGMTFVSEDGNKSTTFEDDYASLRRDLWLATDALYKRSLSDLSKKKAAFENRVRSDTTADFSLGKPYTFSSPRLAERFDESAWKEKTKRLSTIFKKYPAIQSSDVSTGFSNEYAYFVSNDGSQNTRARIRVWVEAKARTQAPDGMPLTNFVAFYGNSVKELPDEKEMSRQIEEMAKELTSLRDAPTLDSYSGPALIELQAAAELISQGLGGNLCNIREPASESPSMEQSIRANLGDVPFINRIGARVLPEFLSLTDSPAKTTEKGVPLIGSIAVDIEGVLSKDVKLVDKGFLKTLLTSRTPHKRISESNGHARAFPSQAFFTNLIVTSSQSLKLPDLKKRLILLCKDRGLEYGIIIRKISNPYFRMQLREIGEGFTFFGPTGARPLITEPILVYKVYPGGREQLVRGTDFTGLTVQTFKEILAVSQDEFVYNHLASARKPSLSGFIGSQDVRVSVTTPSLLFENIDLKQMTGSFRTPPIATHPVFGNKY